MYCNWTKLNKKVKVHASSSAHLNSVVAFENYKDAHLGKQPTVDTMYNQSRKKLFEANCPKLDAVIDCVLLCCRQNIPLCGHSDSNSSQAVNKGNFKAILEFKALGDPQLQKHLLEGAKNVQYTSPRIQNEIIKICGSLTLENIGSAIKQNGLYSIICNECTDSANKEQLSMSVRFVFTDKICESFVGYYELKHGVTGEAVCATI